MKPTAALFQLTTELTSATFQEKSQEIIRVYDISEVQF